jgi:hypothetical protein
MPGISSGGNGDASKPEADVFRRSAADRTPDEHSAMDWKKQIGLDRLF